MRRPGEAAARRVPEPRRRAGPVPPGWRAVHPEDAL